MDFGADGMEGDDEVIDLGGDGEDEGIDFVFDNDTATHRKAEMTAAEPTVETPTIRNRLEKNTPASDATAEIDLDDLGLDLEGLDDTEFADLDDDDATELASLDDLDETGRNQAVDRPAATGRNPRVSAADNTLIDEFDLDDDEFSSTRTGMRLAPDETGVNPALSTAEETGGDIDVDLLAATGRTQVLTDDFAVESYVDDDLNIGDNDKTMLAGRLREDFDYAKTEALPPGTYPGDTAERTALGSADVDLDLDDLTQTLRQSVKGDTVEQRRDDATVEHRRPYIEDDETAETLSFAPDDLSDELDEARTMTEVGTKLDLARAYVDMGDPAGARSILEEVLDEGDTSQRQQAKKLLDSLPS
jgi:pilus assembly protein FimV